MIKKVFSAIFLIFFTSGIVFSQPGLQNKWVDSVYNTLNTEEKIGQLFMIPAYASGNEQHFQVLDNLVAQNKIGGLIFMQGSPGKQVKLTNRFQQQSKVPLLIGMDLEWGLAMRLDSTIRFPAQMTLGAITDDSLIYDMAADIARQMKVLGVHINFAPVADINSNPANPVIGMRSFGEDKLAVAQKCGLYFKGLQNNGILACAKHFPGHGDTHVDSREALPVINKSKAEIFTRDIYPFQQLIQKNVAGIMTDHLKVPSLDKSKQASMSPYITGELLRKELGFEGLIFTDALNMKAVSEKYGPGELEVQALKAGNDVLLFPSDVAGAIKKIKKALKNKKIKKEELEAHVKRVLKAKYQAGLAGYRPLMEENVLYRLNAPASHVLNAKLYEQSVTTVLNNEGTLPIATVDNKYFASLSFGSSHTLLKHLNNYAFFEHYNYEGNPFDLGDLSYFDYLIIAVARPLSDEENGIVRDLSSHTNVIICHFDAPYSLKNYPENATVLCLYESNNITQRLAAEAIFGAIGTSAKLPVSASEALPAGTGIPTEAIQRLGYALPEAVAMSSNKLNDIDKVAAEAISDMATPGCQVLVARKGKVIFDRSYGYYTYDSLKPVSEETIYDIASITKVFASMQAFMFMEERGLVDLDTKIVKYLPGLKGSNKEDMIFRDILTHQAGLWPYLPFWKQTLMEDESFNVNYYSNFPNPGHPFQVSSSLYANEALQDSVWQWVVHSKLRTKEPNKPYGYKYSDMGYYLVQRLAESYFNQPLEEFLQQNFYDPMGVTTLSYLPLCKFPLSRIAPTEEDVFFRKTLVSGMVHDQGAALFGGVAGHAGLFSNAYDLAAMMQMHLQGGYYGGHRYFKSSTLEKFTKQQYADNRRGLGWDKPLRGEWYGPTSEYASLQTFGHTGFTGTAVWADPEFDLVYVFLSNRIYPDAANNKLIKNNIRTRIQDVIYEAIWEYEQNEPYNKLPETEKQLQWQSKVLK